MGAKAFVKQGALAVPGFPVANLVAHLVTVVIGALAEGVAFLIETVFHVTSTGRKIRHSGGYYIWTALSVHQLWK